MLVLFHNFVLGFLRYNNNKFYSFRMIKLRDFKRALLALYIALLARQTQEHEKRSNQQKN